MSSFKQKFIFPNTHTFVIFLSVFIIFGINNFFSINEPFRYSVLTYGFMAIFFNIRSEKTTVWSGIIKIGILILSYIFLYSFSDLSNWELSIVIMLFTLPLFSLVISLLAQYFSNILYQKRIVFIDLKLISLVAEKKISSLDVAYSIVGWLSIILWLIIMYSSKH
jgi:hypothetical protein